MPILSLAIIGGIDERTDPRDRPDLLLKDTRVQRMLLELARYPLPLSLLQVHHAELAPAVQQLVELNVLRLERGVVYLNFPLVTREDRELLVHVGQTAAQTLGQAILDHRGRLQRELASYPLAHVPKGRVAFMLIGCCFLDLVCGRALTNEDYMAPLRQMPGNNRYTIMMHEETPELSLRELYWGCHSERSQHYVFSTFGDHGRGALRRAFPDLLWTSNAAPDALPGLRSLVSHSLVGVLDRLGAALEAADGRRRPDLADLATRTLRETRYVDESQGTLHVVAPLFTAHQTTWVQHVFGLLQPEVLNWMASHQAWLAQELASMTCLRHGLSFTEAMVVVWHYLLGLTNRQLVRQGFFADPYSGDWDHYGYVPGVYPAEWTRFLGYP